MSTKDSDLYQKMGMGFQKASISQDTKDTTNTDNNTENQETDQSPQSTTTTTTIPRKTIAERRREALLNAKNRQNLIYGLPPGQKQDVNSTTSPNINVEGELQSGSESNVNVTNEVELIGSSSNNLRPRQDHEEGEEGNQMETREEEGEETNENDQELDNSGNSMRSVPSTSSMTSLTSNTSSIQSQQNSTTLGTTESNKSKEEEEEHAAKQKEKWARRRKQKRNVNMDVIIASKEAVIAENKGKKETDDTSNKDESTGNESTQAGDQTKVEEKIRSIPKLTGNARRNKYLNAKKEKEKAENINSDPTQKIVGLGTKAMSETSGPSISVFDIYEKRMKMKKSYFGIIVQYIFGQPWFLSSYKRLMLMLLGFTLAIHIGHTEDYVYADYCIDPLSYIMKETPISVLENANKNQPLDDATMLPPIFTDSGALLQNKLEEFFKEQDSAFQNSYANMEDYLGIKNYIKWFPSGYNFFTGGPINCIPFLLFVLCIYLVFNLLEYTLFLLLPHKMIALKFEEQKHRPVANGGYIEKGLKMFGAHRAYELYSLFGRIYQDLLYFFFFFLTTLALFPYLNLYKPLIMSYLSPYLIAVWGGLGSDTVNVDSQGVGLTNDGRDSIEMMKEEL